MDNALLIYGSNGYTGDLITRLALKHGLRPVLAGRTESKIVAQAGELGLDYRVFPLDSAQSVAQELQDCHVVAHCAGPFSHTAEIMADACIRSKTHYLDITGEITVFESLATRDADAKEAGIMLLPGAGFDVVPTDCLAAHLKERLPTATHLDMAFEAGGGISRGTATTMIEGIGEGGMIRKDGVLTPVPSAWKTRKIDFGNGPVSCLSIPWGDVSTAFHSTGIPNIMIYMAAPLTFELFMKLNRYIGWLLASPPLQWFLKIQLLAQRRGPSEEKRLQGQSLLWGEVTDANGNRAEARLTTPEGYTLTAATALAIAERALANDVPSGFQTPSSAFGADFILEFDGCSRSE